jgi:Glycosyltransferase like family 2
MPTASVVVATFKRPDRLIECLNGIRAQARTPDEVIVVVHSSDEVSATLVKDLEDGWSELRCVRIDRPGTVAAYNHGLAATSSDYICYVDDDAVPNPDWLARIVEIFEQDHRIAGVGGRDIVIKNGVAEAAPPRPTRLIGPLSVGRIQWVGRMTANHHIASGGPRDVDVLKGVNMSFRRAVLRHWFDDRLRGTGAQVHSELSVCLPLRRRGFRLVYDPNIVVQHYPAHRAAGDARGAIAPEAVRNAAHNETLAILEYLGPLRRLVFVVYGLAVGSTDSPGLLVTARSGLRGEPAPWSRFVAAQQGRADAWRTLRTARRTTLSEPALASQGHS